MNNKHLYNHWMQKLETLTMNELEGIFKEYKLKAQNSADEHEYEQHMIVTIVIIDIIKIRIKQPPGQNIIAFPGNVQTFKMPAYLKVSQEIWDSDDYNGTVIENLISAVDRGIVPDLQLVDYMKPDKSGDTAEWDAVGVLIRRGYEDTVKSELPKLYQSYLVYMSRKNR